MSVGALVLSPLASGLFHRGIMQSGSPASPLITDSIARSTEKTVITAKKVNCTVANDHNLSETMNCLAKKSVKDLQAAQVNDFLTSTFFIPVYGDEVLPVRPDVALKTGKFNHVDLIVSSFYRFFYKFLTFKLFSTVSHVTKALSLRLL